MQGVPLRPTTIRFASDAHDLVNKAADRAGCSVAQFIREAAIMRAMLVLQEESLDLQALSLEVRQLSRRDD